MAWIRDRLRAALVPRAQAYREAGWNTSDDDGAYSHACRLERRPGVKERIAFLSRQAEDLIAEKRRRLEEALWNIHESDPGMFWETYEAAKTGSDGKLATDQQGKLRVVRKQRPKLINDLPLEARKLIADVTVDKNGNVIPKLYSRSEANRELRRMHNIGAQEGRAESDASRLTDVELLAQLSDTVKELGINIDLNYTFAQLPPAAETDVADSELVESDAVEPAAAEPDVVSSVQALDVSDALGLPEVEKPDRNSRESVKSSAAAKLRYGQIAPWGSRPKVRR